MEMRTLVLIIYFRDRRTKNLIAFGKYANQILINSVEKGKGLVVVKWLGGKRKYQETKGKGKAKARIMLMGEWEWIEPFPHDLQRKFNYKIITDEILQQKNIEFRDKKLDEIEKYFQDKKIIEKVKDYIKTFSLDFYYEIKNLLFKPKRKPIVRDSTKLTNKDVAYAKRSQDLVDKLIIES